MKKTAFITGVTSGIGKAAAKIFTSNEWKVIGIGRRQERLRKLGSELGEESFYPLELDVREIGSIDYALKKIPINFAKVDLLINNAGLALGTSPAQSSSLDQWRQMIDTNITGLAALTHKMLPKLIAQKGMIINVGSVAGTYPYPGGNVYGGTKAFVSQFSLGLRSDLSGTGVRVTSFEPGMTETEFTLVRTSGDQKASDKLYEGAQALQGVELAETLLWIAELPVHMNVNRIELMTVNQSFGPFQVNRDT